MSSDHILKNSKLCYWDRFINDQIFQNEQIKSLSEKNYCFFQPKQEKNEQFKICNNYSHFIDHQTVDERFLNDFLELT